MIYHDLSSSIRIAIWGVQVCISTFSDTTHLNHEPSFAATTRIRVEILLHLLPFLHQEKRHREIMSFDFAKLQSLCAPKAIKPVEFPSVAQFLNGKSNNSQSLCHCRKPFVILFFMLRTFPSYTSNNGPSSCKYSPCTYSRTEQIACKYGTWFVKI